MCAFVLYPYGVNFPIGDKSQMERRLMKANKEKTLDRLSRLEGQVRGIAKMVEANRYCMDILAQTAAIRSAVLGVEKLVLENHAQHCVGDLFLHLLPAGRHGTGA
jgi:DNA-binding FrmR family transcriptional regulator